MLDTYYENKKEYNNEYHNFKYNCDPFYKERHKKYMKNWYLNQNRTRAILKSQQQNEIPIITISHKPKKIIWS